MWTKTTRCSRFRIRPAGKQAGAGSAAAAVDQGRSVETYRRAEGAAGPVEIWAVAKGAPSVAT